MTDVFDREELLEELDGDREFLEESLEMLDDDAPRLLEEIRAGMAQGDADAIRVGAHTIKSMVGNFCAQPAVEAALSLENLGRAGDLAKCDEGLQLLESEVSRLQQALHDFLNEDA